LSLPGDELKLSASQGIEEKITFRIRFNLDESRIGLNHCSAYKFTLVQVEKGPKDYRSRTVLARSHQGWKFFLGATCQNRQYQACEEWIEERAGRAIHLLILGTEDQTLDSLEKANKLMQSRVNIFL
jgi:hypothetical protein